MSETIKVFVGASARNEDLESQLVLHHSLLKHTTSDVSIEWMRQSASGPYAGWKCEASRTPFSSFRWSIPAMCGYQGKGIYIDSDFVLMADISELWHQPIPGVFLAKVGKKGLHKTCCMLFDCAKAKGHVPDLSALRSMEDPQGRMMQYFTARPSLYSGFDGDWNAIDLKGYDDINDPRIKAIHYSRVEHQVHLLKYAIPRLKAEGRTHWYTGPVGPHPRADLQALFDTLYQEALDAGHTLDEYRVGAFDGAKRKNFTYAHSRVTA